MMPIELHRPDALYLLLLLPVWWALVWPRAGGGVLFTRGDAARTVVGAAPAGLLLLPVLLRSLAMAALVIALADPHRVEMGEEASIEGMGIGLVVDLSTSMLATDMEEGGERISVAREAAIHFALGRPHDELSLVGFAREAVTRVPPTRDRELIVHGVETLEIGLVRDGTDISMALLTAVTRLLESEREPRVVILLTDGAHNGTGVPPLTAARAAAALGVRVHTVSVLGAEAASRSRGAGANGELGGAARFARQAEEEMRTVLQGIGEITGGEYFHATHGAALDSIYREIDRLEPTREGVTEREERRSERGWPLLFALVFLALDVTVRGSRWGVIP